MDKCSNVAQRKMNGNKLKPKNHKIWVYFCWTVLTAFTVVVDCLRNVITSWKLREGFSAVFVIFWDYLLGRYVLCCWSDDYGYELCPNRKSNPLRLHFHNCVFHFRFLYVLLLFNFVGDPNMNRPLLYHCNSPFSFHCFTFEQLSKSALETIFFRFLFATRVCYAVVQFKIVHTTHRVRIVSGKLKNGHWHSCH